MLRFPNTSPLMWELRLNETQCVGQTKLLGSSSHDFVLSFATDMW